MAPGEVAQGKASLCCLRYYWSWSNASIFAFNKIFYYKQKNGKGMESGKDWHVAKKYFW